MYSKLAAVMSEKVNRVLRRGHRGTMLMMLAMLVMGMGIGWAQTTPPAAGIPDPIAKVNGLPISRQAYEQRLSDYYGVYVMQNLIAESLLEAEAKKRNVTVTDAEITARLEESKKTAKLLSPEAFRNWLIQNEYTENRLRNEARLELLIEKTFATDAVVKDSEVINYYEKNKSDFTIRASVDIWYMTARTEDVAKKAIELLRAGRDFPSVVKELKAGIIEASEKEPSQVMIFTLPVELKALVEKASPGDIIGPVKRTANPGDKNAPAIAYNVYRVESRQPEKVQTFDEVKDLIRKKLFYNNLYGNNGEWILWRDKAMKNAAVERLMTFTGEPITTTPAPK
jgi:foldase protein PrsA